MNPRMQDFTADELESLFKAMVRMEVLMDHGYFDENAHNREHLELWKVQAKQAEINKRYEEKVNLN